MIFTSTSSLWQLDKKQDWSFIGTDTYGNAIAIVFDGHGTDYCLSVMKHTPIKQLEALFEGKDIIETELGFNICIYGTTSDFTVKADNGSGCVLTLARNDSVDESAC